MTALRHRCRNTPRCGLKLPGPVENPHRAFCCKGCYTQFYRKRCLVCERSKARPDGKINIKHPTCWRRACKAELRQYPHVFVRKLPHIVCHDLGSGNADGMGLKTASEAGVGWSSTADGAKRIHLDDGRVFRVWGPTPTKRQVELWATPQDAAAPRLARTNALPEDFCRGGSGVPYNVVGGYRFPNEPNRGLRKRTLTGLETWAKAGDPNYVAPPELTDETTPSPYPQSDDPWCIPTFLLRTEKLK
jgi:hypothetical protein